MQYLVKKRNDLKGLGLFGRRDDNFRFYLYSFTNFKIVKSIDKGECLKWRMQNPCQFNPVVYMGFQNHIPYNNLLNDS